MEPADTRAAARASRAATRVAETGIESIYLGAANVSVGSNSEVDRRRCRVRFAPVVSTGRRNTLS
jgi:hypothetical protein